MKRRESKQGTGSASAKFDFESYLRQQTTFAVLNLFILATLLLLHTLFSEVLGNPSAQLLVTLGTAFLIEVLVILWLRTRPALSKSATVVLNWAAIAFNLALALLFTFFTNREESPYFVLLALPVLQASYQFRLPALISIIAVADAMMFFWVWHFSTFHPPVQVSEYLEAGTIALIYSLMGLLVWSLVNRIRTDHAQLEQNLDELQRTRLQLAHEEKLAAVGRLSSAIAHEIRNPVAMIASSMATAKSAGITPKAREEMYEIATAEAARLERLTSDFLSYARPSTPNRTSSAVSDLLGYIAEIASPHALRRGVSIAATASETLHANLDTTQVQRALLNLVMNAIDAAKPGSTIQLRAERLSEGALEIQVRNAGVPISDEVLASIFEPFYTTKPQGTGLGLAIARNIARAHGGDVYLACNEPQRVCFAMTLKDEKTATGG